MDIGDFRGLVTAVLLALFVGLLISSFSRRRKAEYRAAERLPLDDDGAPPPAAAGAAERGHPAGTEPQQIAEGAEGKGQKGRGQRAEGQRPERNE
ncbi:MAG TPA: hypothetical protein VFY03_09330 [Woeseiaceae bacterium]|nr:hypothetical protein [Woeseiaceae bacterium]